MPNNIFTSILIVSFMLLSLSVCKYFLGKKIPPSWKYRLGYLFFLILILPFIPFVSSGSISSGAGVHDFTAGTETAGEIMGGALGAINSFAVNKTVNDKWIIIILFWAVGAAAVTVLFLLSAFKLSTVFNSSKPVNESSEKIFDKCKKELGICGKINLRVGNVKSPMVFGIFNTYVIIPDENISREDMRHILMHELIHYKRGDIAINYAVCIFEILYWFNPVVWIAFRGLKSDMEEACDEAVMEKTGDGYGYGMTIIRFAGKREFVSAAEMGGTKKQIIKRVRAAAEFKRATIKQRVISAVIFTAITAAVVASLPMVSVNAIERETDTSDKNIVEEDMSEYFNGISGSAVIYDFKNDIYTVYNRELSQKRVSPDSTYKIFSALSALESGVIDTEYNTLEWNGETYPFEQWNKDQNLYSAMQNSVNWYFNILNENNRKNLEQMLTTFGYGNCDLSGGNDFWMESSLKISPIEQIDVLKALYFNDYGYEDENIQAVKDSMKISEGLYGKTGSGMVNGKEVNGWFVGFAEKDNNVWFFAINMNDVDGANGISAAQTAVEILYDRGIINYEI